MYQASVGKEAKELDVIVANFSNYLAEHHLVYMIPNILAELEVVHFSKEGIVSAEVTSSEELPSAEIKQIADLVKGKVNGEAREGSLGQKTSKEVVVKTETEKDLIGGAVIKYNDKIIDMSIRHQLNNLAKQLSN